MPLRPTSQFHSHSRLEYEHISTNPFTDSWRESGGETILRALKSRNLGKRNGQKWQR